MHVGSIGRPPGTMFSFTLMATALVGCGGGSGQATEPAAALAVPVVVAPLLAAPVLAVVAVAADAAGAALPPASVAVADVPASMVSTPVVAAAVVAPDLAVVSPVAQAETPSTPASAAEDSPAAVATKVSPRAVTQSASRIAVALADMTTPHEVVPLGVGSTVGWKYKPSIGSNTEPYGWAIPSYWTGIRYPEWRAMVPWFVIYQGEPSNPATNVQVEVSGLETWVYLSSTRRWQLLAAAAKPAWDSVYAPNAVDLVSSTTASLVSAVSVRYTTTASAMVHGGLGQVATPWAGTSADIRALYVSVRHRLVVKDTAKADDRAVANIGVQSGLDYYPWMGSKPSDVGAPYVPGAGGGRFIKVTSDWRYSTLLLKKDGVLATELTSSAMPSFSY